MTASELFVQEYATTVKEDLTANSKVVIDTLTTLASENVDSAPGVVAAIERHVQKCPREHKLPALFLVDSIAKNVGEPYRTLFSSALPTMFLAVWNATEGRRDCRKALLRMYMTWKNIFAAATLASIDSTMRQKNGTNPPQPQKNGVAIPTSKAAAIIPTKNGTNPAALSASTQPPSSTAALPRPPVAASQHSNSATKQFHPQAAAAVVATAGLPIANGFHPQLATINGNAQGAAAVVPSFHPTVQQAHPQQQQLHQPPPQQRQHQQQAVAPVVVISAAQAVSSAPFHAVNGRLNVVSSAAPVSAGCVYPHPQQTTWSHAPVMAMNGTAVVSQSQSAYYHHPAGNLSTDGGKMQLEGANGGGGAKASAAPSNGLDVQTLLNLLEKSAAESEKRRKQNEVSVVDDALRLTPAVLKAKDPRVLEKLNEGSINMKPKFLDWRFQIRRDRKKRAYRTRNWYAEPERWLEDSDPTGLTPLELIKKLTEPKVVKPEKNIVLIDDENPQTHCAISGDPLEKYFDTELEDWYYKDCKRVYGEEAISNRVPDGAICIVSCLKKSDVRSALLGLTDTPVNDILKSHAVSKEMMTAASGSDSVVEYRSSTGKRKAESAPPGCDEKVEKKMKNEMVTTC